MMPQIRIFSKTKTMVVFQLQAVNSSGFEAFDRLLSSNENSRFNLLVVARLCPRTQPQRARGWRCYHCEVYRCIYASPGGWIQYSGGSFLCTSSRLTPGPVYYIMNVIHK